MKKVIVIMLLLCVVTIVLAKPSVSGWDGVCYCVKDYLKENLKDPKSLKIINCSVVQCKDGEYYQRVKYRAKNSFGGYVIENMAFKLEPSYNSYKVVFVMDFEEFKLLFY